MAYALVQDLMFSSWVIHLGVRVTISQQSSLTSYQYLHQGNAQTPTYKVETKGKSIERNAKGKSIERDFFALSYIIKCYDCQDYGHVAANCSTPFKIDIIDRVSIESLKPDSTISSKVTSMIKEFNVASSAITIIVSFVAVAPVARPFPSWFYCPHHILCLFYCRLLLSLLVSFIYYRHHPLSPCSAC